MNIQPQPQAAQLHQQQQPQQTHIISNHSLGNDLRASSPANNQAALNKQINSTAATLNNNSFLITNSNNSNNAGLATATGLASNPQQQGYFIQGQENSTGVMTAIKQQQQFQQFNNQNNEIRQQQQLQPQIANNLKYYMTNSPGQQQTASPRIINVQNNGTQQQGTYIQVNQEQQSQQNIIISGQSLNGQSATSTTMQNSNGQIFLNINNRIVPIQALNLKQTNGQSNSPNQANQTSHNTNCTTTALNTSLANANQVVHSPTQPAGQRIQILGNICLEFYYLEFVLNF